MMCEHPLCTRSISKKCSNHCQLDLCEEHLIEHEHLFLIQYEKSFNNLKKSFQNLLHSIEERRKTLEDTHRKNLALIDDHSSLSSNEFEQKSSLILSTQNLIKKKRQLLQDARNDQALLYQYDIEQLRLYRKIISDYQPTDIQIVSSSSSSSTTSSSSSAESSSTTSSSHSNFNPDSENDEEEEDGEKKRSYQRKSELNTRRKAIIDYYGSCPLTRPGLYGLQPKHNVMLCTSQTNRSDHHLMKHFYHDHHIKWSLAYQLTKAVMNQFDPQTTCVFSSNMDIIDKRFYVRYCPLKEMGLSNCRKKFFKNSLDQHLLNVHHLSFETRKQIVQTIEADGCLSSLHLDRNEFNL